MTIREIIAKKRHGIALEAAEIAFFVRGYLSHEIPDYQASALLMAICLKGMNAEETLTLTREMRDSGAKLRRSRSPGKRIDKHSTGGVGDKTSLLVAPIAAVCGIKVPMITGRALGHTGGTLDKLQAIRGFDPQPSSGRIASLLDRHGAVLMGQTPELAPADARLYALRDATGTVESIPLITASILSKKLAENLDGLVLDVKTGSGSFMPTTADAMKLARCLEKTCRRLGTKVVVVLSRMDQPLGRAVGNALEVRECLEFLKGNAPEDLATVTFQLAAEMILLAGRATTANAAHDLARRAVSSGAALDRFMDIVAGQKGDTRVLRDPDLLPMAGKILAFRARGEGFLLAADARSLGDACNALGAGRERIDDAIDPSVGLILHKKVGDRVLRGDVLCEVHWNDRRRLRAAMPLVKAAFKIGSQRPRKVPVIHSILKT